MNGDAPERRASGGESRPRPVIVENSDTPKDDGKATREPVPQPENDGDDSEPNFIALVLGFLVVLGLLIAGWWIVNQMRCNPLYSNAGLSHSRACQ